MERQEIRYHPLIDSDTEGTEKVPLFVTTNKEGIPSMYLSEMIPGYFRLRSKEPVSLRASDELVIHCPMCGGHLRKMTKNNNATELGLYTCDRCR